MFLYFSFINVKEKISLSTNANKHCKQNKQTTTLHPTNKPQVSLKLNITSLERGAYKGKQANKFGMNRLSNNTDIKKVQEVPSINLNLQTKAAQYLVQQGQTKERGRGKSNKRSSFLIFFYKMQKKNYLQSKASR